MHQLSQTLHKTKGNPFFSAGLKKTEGTSSLRLFSKLPGHPAELSDSVKLLLTDAKSHVFDINLVLKSIH